MTFIQLTKRFVPPIVVDAAKVVFRGRSTAASTRTADDPQEFAYVPEGWAYQSPRLRGADAESPELERRKWPLVARLLQGSGPLGIAHEASSPTNTDFEAHNVIMSYAYVLAVAARKRDRMSLLDWGGSLGHYYPLSKALLPDVTFDYHCKELPRFCAYGRELLPDARFHEDDAYAKQQYDLVLMSGVLQCIEDWRGTLKQAASVSREWLYVTRLPIVDSAKSFVAVQRPYHLGYQYEYLFWFLNRAEFLTETSKLGLQLVREFLIHPAAHVENAPERGDLRGFLFRRAR